MIKFVFWLCLILRFWFPSFWVWWLKWFEFDFEFDLMSSSMKMCLWTLTYSIGLDFDNVKIMGTNQYNTYWRNSTLTLIREMDTFNNWTGHLFSLIFISTIQVQLNNSTLEGEPLQYVSCFCWLPLQVPLLVEKYVLL